MDVAVADELGQVVVLGHGHGGALAVDEADVDGQDLLLVRVEHDAEVEGVGVLVVELGGAVVGQPLLQAAVHAPAVVEADGPGIEEDLGHVGDADLAAHADDALVGAADALAHIEVLERQRRGHVVARLRLLDGARRQVHDQLGHGARGLVNDDGKGAAVQPGELARLEGRVLILARLAQGDAVEFDCPKGRVVSDDLGGRPDLFNRQLIWGIVR